MDDTGVVKSTDGPKAVVIVRRQSACDSCASGGSCGGEKHGTEIEAFNMVRAETGDTVRISFKAFTYLKGSLLIYGIPALALIAGAVSGKELLAPLWPAMDAELVSAMAAFGGMIISFVCIRFIIKRFEKRKELVPVIEEVLSKGKATIV